MMPLNSSDIGHGINIIDIEASGLHFDSYPIEIAVLVNGRYHSWLIKPDESWTYWCEKAEALHGITRAQLFEEGLTISVVVEELSEVLRSGNGVIYSDADRWDEDWLNTLFFTSNARSPVNVLPFFDLLSNEQRALYQNIKDELSRSGEYRIHRALDDIKLIRASYERVLGIPSVR